MLHPRSDLIYYRMPVRCIGELLTETVTLGAAQTLSREVCPSFPFAVHQPLLACGQIADLIRHVARVLQGKPGGSYVLTNVDTLAQVGQKGTFAPNNTRAKSGARAARAAQYSPRARHTARYHIQHLPQQEEARPTRAAQHETTPPRARECAVSFASRTWLIHMQRGPMHANKL